MVATVTPAEASNKAVTWSVENGTGKATISSTGLLTAVADGTVTVKATAKDGSGVIGTTTITISNQEAAADVDTTEYDAIVATVPANNDAGTYTADSWTVFAEAIAECDLELTEADGQAALDAEVIKIQEALDLLKEVTYVAQIGEVKYETLAEAVEAAVGETTITLLADASGEGIFLAANEGKNITIDFGGKTYTITSGPVGSTGYETQGLHLEKGNTVTLKNGKLTSSADSGVKMLVQKYCDLTLEDMELDGTKLSGSGTHYVLSNNNGITTLTGKTTITAAEGDVAFDVYYWPSNGYKWVTVEIASYDVVINGTVGYASDGGEGFAENAKLIIPSGYELKAPEGYKWVAQDGKQVLVDTSTVEDAGTAHYTLAEFNALTEIPEDVKVVYLDIGDVSLANGDVTIGNKDICDMWTWDRNTDHNVGEILEDGRKVYMVRDTDTIYSSNKAGITLYISGSVKDNPEGGLNQSDSHAITFSIPDASNVVFTKDFTVNGYFRMSTGWSDGRNLGGAFYNRTVKSVLFDHSTFNGIWIQNGGFFADSLTLDGCTFNAYENNVSTNDSNPLWFCNIRTCDVTVKNCTFKASRPIKVVEQAVFGANVTITDNKFDMSLTNSADDASKPKNDAIMFSTLIGETQSNPAGTLGNVVVSGNEVTGANSLLTFFNPSQITMANGATFKVSDNILNGAKLSVEWKTATEYTPDFVK